MAMTLNSRPTNAMTQITSAEQYENLWKWIIMITIVSALLMSERSDTISDNSPSYIYAYVSLELLFLTVMDTPGIYSDKDPCILK